MHWNMPQAIGCMGRWAYRHYAPISAKPSPKYSPRRAGRKEEEEKKTCVVFITIHPSIMFFAALPVFSASLFSVVFLPFFRFACAFFRLAFVVVVWPLFHSFLCVFLARRKKRSKSKVFISKRSQQPNVEQKLVFCIKFKQPTNRMETYLNLLSHERNDQPTDRVEPPNRRRESVRPNSLIHNNSNSTHGREHRRFHKSSAVFMAS